jgi:predicted ester cyclase
LASKPEVVSCLDFFGTAVFVVRKSLFIFHWLREGVLVPLQGEFARAFAREWVEAWNSHDIGRILEHYDDEVVLVSPVAMNLLKNDGSVRGKEALRSYFLRGLEAYPDLRFDLTEVLWGVETVVLIYANNVRGNKTAEVMQIGSAGKVVRVWANYGE